MTLHVIRPVISNDKEKVPDVLLCPSRASCTVRCLCLHQSLAQELNGRRGAWLAVLTPCSGTAPWSAVSRSNYQECQVGSLPLEGWKEAIAGVARVGGNRTHWDSDDRRC
eukprot:1673001-Rhodomonas_salina.3